MLNEFESFTDKKIRKANIILLEIPRSNTNLGSGMNKDEVDIIGGYASHGWAVSQKDQGEESCFLFNLNQNLRFKAVKDRGPYQVTDTSSDKNNRKIMFGKGGALIIENDFKRITSKIGDP